MRAGLKYGIIFGIAVCAIILWIVYMSTLNPRNIDYFESCLLEAGYYCKDFMFVDRTYGFDGFNFTFQNAKGDIMIEQVIVQGVYDSSSIRCDTGDTLLKQTWNDKRGLYFKNFTNHNIEVPCGNAGIFDDLSPGTKTFDLAVTWYDAALNETYNQTMTGRMRVHLE
ncbi:MAG: hypothetical protein V1702_02140 [Candidatus Woesearchaeota archaeon]